MLKILFRLFLESVDEAHKQAKWFFSGMFSLTATFLFGYAIYSTVNDIEYLYEICVIPIFLFGFLMYSVWTYSYFSGRYK